MTRYDALAAWQQYGNRITMTIVGAAAFVVYWRTLAPGVLPADSGEFQLVAAQLGLAHPPGFALYTLLAHVVTRLPVGPDAAYRVNLFAAVTSASTLVIVYAIARRLTYSRLAGVAAAAVLATSTTFWAQSTTANIRSMTALLAAIVFALLLRYRDADSAERKQRLLNLIAVAVALAVTHHLSLAFMALAWGGFVMLVDGWNAAARKRWLRAAPWALLGLLPLLYLPLAEPALRDPGAWLAYALGLGFRGDFFAFGTASGLLARLPVMVNVLTFQFNVLLLLGMALGLIVAVVRDWRLALLFGGAFGVHALVTAIYRAPQTVEYMLPAYVPLVILLVVGVMRARVALVGRWAWVQWLLLFGILALAVAQGVALHPSYAALSRFDSAETTAGEILASAPADARVLANWHWVTPLWYSQQVLGERADLQVDYVVPQSAPYAETWAASIATGLTDGASVVATNYDPLAFAALPPFEPLGGAFLYRQTPRVAVPDSMTPVSLVLGDALRIDSVALNRDSAEQGAEVTLTVAWRAEQPTDGVTLFAHLVGQDGALYAQDDVPARAFPDGVTLTQLRLTPRPGTPLGTAQVLVGAYRADGTPLLDAVSSPRTHVADLAVLPATRVAFTQNNISERLPDGTFVYGFDWDVTLPDRPRLYLHTVPPGGGYETRTLDGPEHRVGDVTLRSADCRAPCHYVPLAQGIVWTGTNIDTSAAPGGTVRATHHLHADRPILTDNVVSFSLVGLAADGVTWAWAVQDDGVPALGAIPTLKWVAGSTVRDARLVTVPGDAEPGQQTRATLLLYDAFTSRPLAVLDERIAELGVGIPLGGVTIK